MANILNQRISRKRAFDHRRPPLRQRVVIAIPSGLTLANLFFGVFAIVMASRGDFFTAGLYVVFGGVADMLDGRVARATNSGSAFGAQLDSLVDLITFGVAPAMIMYYAVLNHLGWDWIWAFVYIASVAWRLAVFNVEQAGRAKRYFHGLPSPAAGITLATYFWFSQTTLYTDTTIITLPWHQMMRFVMLGLAALMISPIPYPAFPSVGLKTNAQRFGLLLVISVILGVYFIPGEFFFPACLIYISYGFLKTVLLGLFNKRAPDDSSVDSSGQPLSDLGSGHVSHTGHSAREYSRPGRRSSHSRDRGERTDRSDRTDRADKSERSERNREARKDRHKDRDKEKENNSDPVQNDSDLTSEPSVTIASSPRLSVSADTPLEEDAPNPRRRRRRRPPRRDRSPRPDSSTDNQSED